MLRGTQSKAVKLVLYESESKDLLFLWPFPPRSFIRVGALRPSKFPGAPCIVQVPTDPFSLNLQIERTDPR